MSKEKVLVLFGDSLTDYFPMELFKDVEAQVYNRGEAGNTVPEMAARAEMDVVSLRPDLVLMQGGANDYLLPFYRGAEVIAGQLLRTAERILEKLPGTRICIQCIRKKQEMEFLSGQKGSQTKRYRLLIQKLRDFAGKKKYHMWMFTGN